MLRHPNKQIKYTQISSTPPRKFGNVRPNTRTLEPRNKFSPRGERRKSDPVWAYGVTTLNPQGLTDRQKIPLDDRSQSTLPLALESLKGAGFPSPLLFVDNEREGSRWFDRFGLTVVTRYPRIGAFGNWVLGFAELMIRSPYADYYAMFQDDMVTSKNLREYLEATVYPERGYLNLYTFPKNQMLSFGRTGFYKSDQNGKGAVALVFDRESALALITEPRFARRPEDRLRGHKFIDGGIVEAMRRDGFTEYCHNPSLVQHLGMRSTLNNPRHPKAGSFKGETFDLMSLLEPVHDAPPLPQTNGG